MFLLSYCSLTLRSLTPFPPNLCRFATISSPSCLLTSFFPPFLQTRYLPSWCSLPATSSSQKLYSFTPFFLSLLQFVLMIFAHLISDGRHRCCGGGGVVGDWGGGGVGVGPWRSPGFRSRTWQRCCRNFCTPRLPADATASPSRLNIQTHRHGCSVTHTSGMQDGGREQRQSARGDK